MQPETNEEARRRTAAQTAAVARRNDVPLSVLVQRLNEHRERLEAKHGR